MWRLNLTVFNAAASANRSPKHDTDLAIYVQLAINDLLRENIREKVSRASEQRHKILSTMTRVEHNRLQEIGRLVDGCMDTGKHGGEVYDKAFKIAKRGGLLG